MKFVDKFGDYTKTLSTFLAWLRYDQYRSRLLLSSVHPYIVITDITNFFDSVLHNRIAESLHQIAAPPRMIGLLFFILERLSIRDEYSASTGIGLAVEEYDASRTLAHLVLLSHDERMAKIVGEEAYIRWADDQTFGVKSRAEGLQVLSEVGASLARINLTPNASKSKILTLREARRHFHLDLNEMLDSALALPNDTVADKRALRKAASSIWVAAIQHEGVGEWDKILSRIYRIYGKAKLRYLRKRAVQDILRVPTQAKRICDYMRYTGSAKEYLDFAEELWTHPEQIYNDVNVIALEICLRLEPDGETAAEIRRVASSFLKGKRSIPGNMECASLAPLLILRYGDTRSLPLIRSLVEGRSQMSWSRKIGQGVKVYSAG